MKTEMKRCVKESFSVIGKEGSTNEGDGFVMRLWADANTHFDEIGHLAKKNENGEIFGVWGAMSDFSRSFKPWEDGFSKGLYLAGVEVIDGAQAPEGWVKWTIPSYEYLYVMSDSHDTFSAAVQYLNDNGLSLAGAVHEFTSAGSGEGYLFFPIRRL